MSAPKDAHRPEQVEELERKVSSLEAQLERARQEIERLRKELEAALRALKRQAAPFSKGEPKPHPKAPGRKPGSAYGERGSRPVPSVVHERYPVPMPDACLHCGGEVVYQETKPQFQEEVVRSTIIRRFDIDIGRCCRCGRHVQGRHPLQTSDALGAANVQLGPEALTLAAHLNKEMGLSHERVARILKWGYGLDASRSGICRALERMGEKAAPTYEQLLLTVRKSPVNWMDETGWRVAAHLEWLWAVVSEQATVYVIQQGRGFEEAARILGRDYQGFLIHDGLRLYYGFLQAFHQTCLAHLFRRCREMVEAASSTASRFPIAVSALLGKALDLRDRYQRSEISRRGLYIATGRLEAAMDRLLESRLRSASNQRLANHLWHERPHLFSFLYCPGLDATNNTAERAIRPVVVARKTWGGNRTQKGARTQEVLASVLRTFWQQSKDSFSGLVELMRSPRERILDIVPASLPP